MATNFWEKDAVVGAEDQWWSKDKPLGAREEAPKKSTVTGELVRGGKQLASSIRTGAEALFGTPEEAALAGIERGRKISEEAGEGVSLEAIKRAYEKDGLLSAAGEVAGQIPRALAGQGAQLAAMAAAAKAGAMAGTAVAPGVGTVIGGALGAGASLLPQFLGANVERQVQEQIEAGQAPKVDLGRAGAAAAGQAAIEGAGTAFVLGKRVVKGVLGIADDAALATAKAQQEMVKAAERTMLQAAGRGAARGATEIPVEVAQQVLERAQAGLDVTSPEALSEYGEAAYQAALVGGPLGAVSGPIDTGMARQARARIEQANAEREKQKAIQEQQAEQQRLAAERAAEEERMRPIREAEARVPAEEPVGPSITSTGRAALLGGADPMTSADPLAEAIRARREEMAAAEADQERRARVEIPEAQEPTFNILRSAETRNLGLMGALEERRAAREAETEAAQQEAARMTEAERANADQRMAQVENFLLSPARKTQQEAADYIAGVVPEMRKDFLDLLDEDLNQPLTPEQTEALKTQIRQRLIPGAAPEPEAGRTPFKRFLATMGINKQDANDIFGDNAFRANQRLPGAIRADAPRLDMLAEAAVEAGFLRNEDPDALAQMIKDEFFGVEQVPLDMAEERAAAKFESRRLGELQSRAAEIGLDTRGMTPDQIIGRLNRIERTREQQRQRRERETEARTEADIAEATATEREARAETLGAEAVPEVDALRQQARDQGVDISAIEEQAFEEARANPDLNPDTILAERLSDALGVDRRFQKETLEQGTADSGINIDPEDQRIEKELSGKSMIQVADWAIQNAPNAFARVIAEKVKARLLAFQRKGMTLDFKIQGGQNRTLNMRRARGITSFDWGKDDKGTTITVTLNGAAVLDNQNGYPPGTRYSTVLHELLHVATRAQFVFMPNTDPLKKQMIELFNAVADRFNADAKAGNLPPVMMKYYKRMNNVLEDPDEMLAWGLTDRDVQEYFDDIKVGEKSVWSQLVELIRKALGLGKPYESALERLVRASESLLEVDVNSIDDMLGLRDKQIGGKKRPAGPMVQESLFQKEGKPAAMREGRVPQTETEAFKRWFGDSKVVDENGDPLVVYHGTPKEFTEFKEGKTWQGFGFHFGTAEAANQVLQQGRNSPEFGNQRVIPVYLSIKNPLKFDASYDRGRHDPMDIYQMVMRKAEEEGVPGVTQGQIDDYYEDDHQYNGKRFLDLEGQELRDLLREWLGDMGYDGIEYVNAGEDAGSTSWIAFRPQQVKSAIGNIGTFSQETADIRYQREGEPEERVKEPKRNILGKPVLGSWTSPTDTKLAGTQFNKDDLIYSLQDKQVDIKRVVQNITETAGRIAAKWNPYLQEELYHGRTARATKEFLQDELRPLIKEIQRNGMTIEEVEKYLHNRHAEDYNKHVAKVNPKNPKMQDGGSGIKTEDARAYLASIPADKRKVYEDIAKKVDAITKKTRNLVVESGLEGPDTIAAWEKAFPKYVPLMREESDDFDYTTPAFGVGSGFDVRGKFSRAAMGSERKVANILANIAMQREKAIIKSNKNRVAQAVFGLAVQNPNPDFWLAVNPAAETVPEIALDELRAMGIDEGAIEFLMQEPKQRAIDPKKNEVVNRINATLRKSDNVLAMRINGEDRYVFFNQNDPRAKRAAEALKNLDADQLGPVLGIVSQVTRWMASVNTQYNPIFGAYNFLRDVQGAALQLSDTPLRGKQKEVLSGVLPSLKTIYAAMRAERDGKKIDTEMGRLWNEFQEEGGQTGFRDMFSRSQERADALEKEFKQITEGKVKAAGRAVFDWLSDYNDSMENATRLSAYKVAKEKFIKEGMSESEAKQQAASIAKNLTVNFNRKGQIATQAGALYAFFNAAVQGTTRLAQTLRGPAGRKIIAGGLLLGAMQAALLAAAGFDEEEPPEFVRERNIIIPLGGDKYFAFPMPLGYHVIPGFSRIITEWALSGFKNTPERIASLTGMFLEAFNPIGNAGWSVQTLAPTFADPLVALSENKDWTGKPIARKDFSNMDPTPGYTRAKDTASEFSTQIAKFLNYASGGTEFRPGVLSPTPDQIDYLIGQAFGGLGREATKLEQTVLKTATGEELPPYKIPLVGRFYGETKSSAAESNRFYKNLTLLNEHENEIKGRRDKGQPIGDYLKDNPEARLAPMARKTYKDIQQLRKRREQLVERDAPRESVKAVEEQIKRRMAVFNERVAQLKD